MSDELQHVRLAISIADTLSLTPYLRGEDVTIYSQLYPFLIAPFYGFLSTTAAFDAVHIFNAVAMASAAVPVYLLARELGIPKPAATVVATAVGDDAVDGAGDAGLHRGGGLPGQRLGDPGDLPRAGEAFAARVIWWHSRLWGWRSSPARSSLGLAVST